jgi:hypothetical protein
MAGWRLRPDHGLRGGAVQGWRAAPADQPAREASRNDPRSLPQAGWLTATMLPLKQRVAA